MTRGAAGNKNRKCSIEQTVSLHRSFGTAFAAHEGVSLRGSWSAAVFGGCSP